MIELRTDCLKCKHNKVCKYKGNAESDMKKLKEMRYGNGPNDDYDWDIMMKSRHVTITFSCPEFNQETNTVFR